MFHLTVSTVISAIHRNSEKKVCQSRAGRKNSLKVNNSNLSSRQGSKFEGGSLNL